MVVTDFNECEGIEKGGMKAEGFCCEKVRF